MVDAFTLLYLALFVAALVVALVLTPLAARLAMRVGLVDRPQAERFHDQTTPYGGGIAMVATVLLLVGGAYAGVLFLHERCATSVPRWPEPLAAVATTLRPHLDGLLCRPTLYRVGALLAGGLLVFALGLVDDCRGLKPVTKLAVQTVAALLLVAADIRITFFVDSTVVSVVFTVLWVVFVTNAFNLLDNMDGLSAGVAFVASALFFIVALQAEEMFVAAFLAVFAGTLLGFLRYNFSPARLFMGDAGSLFIGFMLASLTAVGTYYEGQGSLAVMGMPLLILGVPLFDTASVMWRRWRDGRPLFEGDTNHFSHRLVRLGMTVREAVLTIYLLGLILGGAATLLKQVNERGAAIILLLGLGVIVLIVLLENAAARKERP